MCVVIFLPIFFNSFFFVTQIYKAETKSCTIFYNFFVAPELAESSAPSVRQQNFAYKNSSKLCSFVFLKISPYFFQNVHRFLLESVLMESKF